MKLEWVEKRPGYWKSGTYGIAVNMLGWACFVGIKLLGFADDETQARDKCQRHADAQEPPCSKQT